MPDITSRPSHLLLSYPCLQRRLIVAILDKILHWLHPKLLQKNAFQLLHNMLKIWHTSFSFLRVQGNIGHSIAAQLGKHVRIIVENRFPSVDYSTVASGQPWLQKKKPSTTLSPTFWHFTLLKMTTIWNMLLISCCKGTSALAEVRCQSSLHLSQDIYLHKNKNLITKKVPDWVH
jgi:hypothetical protein